MGCDFRVTFVLSVKEYVLAFWKLNITGKKKKKKVNNLDFYVNNICQKADENKTRASLFQRVIISSLRWFL